jgi:hypothetical protein
MKKWSGVEKMEKSEILNYKTKITGSKEKIFSLQFTFQFP